MQKVKVVIGINDFVIGGAQKLIADLLKKFDTDTFEFHLVTLNTLAGKQDFYDLVPDHVQIHKFDFKGFADFKSWGKLQQLLKEIKPELVWSHLFFANTIFRLLGILLGYKCISTEHNTYTWKNFFQRSLDTFLSLYTYKIVAVSKTVAEFTAKQEHISKEKFMVIYNGIDTAEAAGQLANLPDRNALKASLGFRTEDKVFVNISRLISQKNHKLLLDGFAAFATEYPEYKLAIVGDGTLMDVLKHQVESAGLTEKIIFFGHRRDVFSLYKIAEAFVSTSLIEGLSVAYLESLASGVPIVATKTAGTDEIIESGKNGFFIEAYDTESVAQALSNFAQADNERMKKAAKEIANRFDLQAIVDQYEALFLGAISQAR